MTNLDLITAKIQRAEPPPVVLVGLPWDGSSSHLTGAAEAPEQIRRTLLSPAGNLFSESGVDLCAPSRLQILGDLELPPGEGPFTAIEQCAETLLRESVYPIFLGGDHSVTQATVSPFETRYPNLTVIHFDAHPDLYETFDGDPHSHACPMTRILEREKLHRLVQVGIRASTHSQDELAKKYDVERMSATIYNSVDWADLQLEGPIYVSFDLDVLDPAFAPGVSHPEPGGLSSRTAITMIQNLPSPIVGADIVELNPSRDLNGLTAGVAAKLVKELASKMIQSTTT
jgi:agmatinase